MMKNAKLFSTGLWQCIVIQSQTHTRKKTRYLPVLFQLHWFHARFRLIYLILFRAFKALCGIASQCLSDLIQQYKSVRPEPYSLFTMTEKPHNNVHGEKESFEHHLSGCGISFFYFYFLIIFISHAHIYSNIYIAGDHF